MNPRPCVHVFSREKGVKIIDLDLTCGDIIVSLNESLISKTSKKLEISSDSDVIRGATLDAMSTKMSSTSKTFLSSIKKQMFVFPEKVCFTQRLTCC